MSSRWELFKHFFTTGSPALTVALIVFALMGLTILVFELME